MPFFVIHGLDGPGGPDIRKATRPAHLSWLESLGVRYKFGSAMLGADGATPEGSIVVIEAKDLAEAKATFAQDPYNQAGLWSRIDVRQLAQWNPK
jgi:uncharacterized protein YciI